ncbi:hypothetical protein [Microbacterium sp. NPDC058345]|uniref:hypothetical protein n=1 Tax=Microbacterium sp. NPDC058345 TaxID=3346455 RepID=UPI0036680278
MTSTVSGVVRDYVSFTAWRDECDVGAPIASTTSAEVAEVTDLPPNAVVDVCVRFMLEDDAPSSLQGDQISREITIDAEQVAS